MNQATIAPRPAFAANIAFVNYKTFNKIMDISKAIHVATQWHINAVDQLNPYTASFTSEVRNCTASLLIKGGKGEISHLNPRNKTNIIDAVKGFFEKHFSSNKDYDSAFIIGAHKPEWDNNKIYKEIKKIFNRKKLIYSYFLKQLGELDMGYLGKEVKKFSDTIFISIHPNPFSDGSIEPFPIKKEDLTTYLNQYFGEWYVSRKDKLMWVNEHLDFNDPNFIEEIPRHLYDKRA